MHTLRSRLALVLLLCFARVLLPDVWVLALHAHEHTTEEPTQARSWPKEKALLSAKHQHCDVDQFYKEVFQTPEPLRLPLAPIIYRSAAAVPPRPDVLGVFTPKTGLRGPPAVA